MAAVREKFEVTAAALPDFKLGGDGLAKEREGEGELGSFGATKGVGESAQGREGE
ncbi:hypothetical protein TIFTF001_029946 [Ficus carica]|uniref:Uncharacterized protein n=1 Tax=Ficus carica TaxID=3494 RepID=A0AA88DSW7_FICCA|nr:hypothetical protein TIFTF001_029946 [Ficus carica]